MSAVVTNELSERLSELFVLSAALYFAGVRQTGNEKQQALLYDVSKGLIEITPSPGEQDAARLKLLRDGLCDAADLALTAGLEQVSEMLKGWAEANSGLLGESMGSAWEKGSE